MEYRQLGSSGLRVSTIALGTMTFGDRGSFAAIGGVDVDEARASSTRRSTPGVNLIDTADVYSGGRSEEIVGEALAGPPRRRRLATKARFRWAPARTTPGSPAATSSRPARRACGGCGTDYIDLYQVHERDGVTPTEETLDALDTLVHAGQGPLHRLLELLRLAPHEVARRRRARSASRATSSQQIYYSLLHREAEYELVPARRRRGRRDPRLEPARRRAALRQVPARRSSAPAGTRHTTEWEEPPIYDEEQLYDIIEVLVEVAEALGRSPAQVALAYLLGKPAVLLGDRRRPHRASSSPTTSAPPSSVLDEAERARLDAVSAPPLLYPYWHQATTASDRLSAGDQTLLSRYQEPSGE